MFDDRKRRYCVIKYRQGIRSLAVDTNKGCMKIPVLRRLNWSVGGERLAWALCPSPEPGLGPESGPESESKMEQHLTSAACRPRAFPPTFPTSLMSVDRPFNTRNLDCRQDG
jgi:hypothetical protein